MVWAIVVVAIAVLGVAAWAGTGRLGEMPRPVNDRPRAHVPDGPIDDAFLAELSLPTVATGYRPRQVDALLAAHVAGEDLTPGTQFDVVARGYDMQVVDAIIDRIGVEEYGEPTAGDAELEDGSNGSTVVPSDADLVAEPPTSVPPLGHSESPHDLMETAGTEDSASVAANSEPSESAEQGADGDLPAR